MTELISKLLEIKKIPIGWIIGHFWILLLLLYFVKVFYRKSFSELLDSLDNFSRFIGFEEWSPVIITIFHMLGFISMATCLGFLGLLVLKERVWREQKDAAKLNEVRNQFSSWVGWSCIYSSNGYLLILLYFNLLGPNLPNYIPPLITSGLILFYCLIWLLGFMGSSYDEEWGWMLKKAPK